SLPWMRRFGENTTRDRTLHLGLGSTAMSERSLFAEELAHRMTAPQRHRLLQGYPMVPVMRAAVSPGPEPRFRGLDGRVRKMPFGVGVHQYEEVEPPFLSLDAKRPLIIGVIPHTQCNPRVKGCGFCTFGQDPYSKSTLGISVVRVQIEIDQLISYA